jgi:hypothetical protein
VPPLGGGEEALVNILPIKLPAEVFVPTTAYSRQQAAAILYDSDEPARFDWVVKGDTFWSFHDPRTAFGTYCDEAAFWMAGWPILGIGRSRG